MPDGEYDTLAGFVLDRLGPPPGRRRGGRAEDGWRFEVADMDRHRIAAGAGDRADRGPTRAEPATGRP